MSPRDPQFGRVARSGATLTEVLLAVLLMGIGVVSLAVLFPISILRSVHAAQLTNAAILRYNAESLIAAHPQLVFDPDSDGDILEHTIDPGNVYIVDPLGDALMQPPFQNKEDVNDNWTLDPAEDLDADSSLDPGTFGNDGAGPSGTLPRFAGGFVDVDGNGAYDPGETNFALEADAADLVAQADSWIFQLEAVPAASTPASVTLPATSVLSQIPVREVDADLDGLPDVDLNADGRLNSITSRAVLFSSNARGGQAREITSIAGGDIRWDEDLDLDAVLDPGEDRNSNGVLDAYPLPAGFEPARIRVLTRDRRYSWLLAVRNSSSDGTLTANVDVVIFFRRPVDDPAAERIYAAWGIPASRPAFQKFSNSVRIDYAGQARPSLKKGGYVFDATNARWYRIADVFDDRAAQRATLTIDRPAIDSSDRAMLMRGIVDVYPIGTIEFSL